MRRKIIYISDPQCGWCYGNAKNITDIYHRFKSVFDFELLNGGMWVDEHSPRGGQQISNYIKERAHQITAITGRSIHSSFFELIADTKQILSSLEPSAAIVLVKELKPESTFVFAKQLQDAMFKEGKPLDVLRTYLPLLKHLDIDHEKFENHWMTNQNLENTFKEFALSKFMTKSYPTLLLQEGDNVTTIASGYFDLKTVESKLMLLDSSVIKQQDNDHNYCKINRDC